MEDTTLREHDICSTASYRGADFFSRSLRNGKEVMTCGKVSEYRVKIGQAVLQLQQLADEKHVFPRIPKLGCPVSSDVYTKLSPVLLNRPRKKPVKKGRP